MASLSSGNFGNTSASSLIRSAQSLQNQLNTYNDTVQRIQFENNPSDAQLQQYTTYLQGRIKNLQSTGSIADATKAIDMTQTVHAAIARNTSFNIQNESIQVLAGNASDEDKLHYIEGAFQRALSIGDMSLAQSLESQGYTLQQSISYHQQQAATATDTLAKANETAIKNGYSDAIGQLTDSYKVITTAFAQGKTAEYDQAVQKFMKDTPALLKQLGAALPKGVTMNENAVPLAYLFGLIAYNEHAAQAVGVDTTDGQKFMQTAQDYASGVKPVDTPYGSMDIIKAVQTAYEPTNLYSPGIDDKTGKTIQVENATIGMYNQTVQTPFGSVTVPLKITSGNRQTPLTAMTTGSDNKKDTTSSANMTKLLQKLGFSPGEVNGSYTRNGKIYVQVSNAQAQSWFKNSDVKSGALLELIPTNEGFQFENPATHQLYSIFMDKNGSASLSVLGADNSMREVGAMQGFNRGQTVNLQYLLNTAQYTQEANKRIAAIQAQADAEHAQAIAALRAKTQAVLSAAHFSPNYVAPQPAKLGGGVAIPSFGGQSSHGPQMTQRAGGGFNFTNNGKAISAATYAQLTGTSFRNLLSTMASRGDAGAKSALSFVGNDMRYDPRKINAGGNANLYNALTWGTGLPSAHVNAPNISGGQLTLPSGLKL